MALFSNAKNIKQAKEAAGQMQAGAIYGLEAVAANAARNVAGEEGMMNVFARLGQPGTYGPGAPKPTGSESIFSTTPTGYAKPGEEFKVFGNFGGTQQLNTTRQGIIDPEKYGDAISKTIPFQIQSQQVAESNQLLNQEGPAWDLLENSTLGQIHQGAAMQLRETVSRLKNNYAKDGAARRAALNEANTIRAQEAAMNMRVEQTWRANLDLHNYVRANADRVAAGTQRFLDGLPGINASYRTAMAESAKLMVFAGETAASIAKEAYEVRASQQARNFGEKLLEGVIMAAISSTIDTGAGMTASYLRGQGFTGGQSGDEFGLAFGMNLLQNMSAGIGGQGVQYDRTGQPQYTEEQRKQIAARAGETQKEASNYQAPPLYGSINPITGTWDRSATFDPNTQAAYGRTQ